MINEKRSVVKIRKNAQRIKTINKWRKIIPSILGVLVALIIMMYVASVLFMQRGSFTVSVREYEQGARYSLTLCESPDFKKRTSRLSVEAAERVNNISVADLPSDLNDVDGSHNGENYLAYTFYLQNSGIEACSYTYKITITRATLGIDGAVRVRVYYNSDYYKENIGGFSYNGAYTDYAKPVTGGNGEAEKDIYGNELEKFASDTLVVEKEVNNFYPKDIAKITVVIWLEGNDLDCTDDMLGGEFRSDMSFEINGAAEEGG